MSEENKEPTIIPTDYTGLPKGVPLNPVQELVYPHIAKDVNVVVQSSPGTGKTVAMSMVAHKVLFGNGRKKVVYLAPMKALVEEKRQDWQNPHHPYSVFPLLIMTGDYVDKWEDQSAITNSRLVVSTPESFISRVRNRTADKSQFLPRVGQLIVDEGHMIDEDNRGGTLEIGLMEFTTDYPDAPIMVASGTFPNIEQLAGWLTKLNGKETVLIKSDWRASRLERKFYSVDMNDKESEERIKLCIKLIQEYPNDQFIFAVFSKAYGRKLENALCAAGYATEFHNADKTKDQRNSIEQRFRQGSLRYLVSTKTLFVGMNLPAQHVVITSVCTGANDIKASELNQAAGRAGRPQFDKVGYAHFFLPSNENDFHYHKRRIEHGETVHSQLEQPQVLALHFLGAMYLNRVDDEASFETWFSRTFYSYQRGKTDNTQLLEGVIEDMKKRGMMGVDEETKKFALKYRGKIACQMAIDPYHLFDLCANFSKYLAYENPTDLQLAKAIGECAPYQTQIQKYGYDAQQIPGVIKEKVHQNYWRSVAAAYSLIRGQEMPMTSLSIGYQIKQDAERIACVLQRLNQECERWGDTKYLHALRYRITGGVDWEVARLMAQGATKSMANRLHQQGTTKVTKMTPRKGGYRKSKR